MHALLSGLPLALALINVRAASAGNHRTVEDYIHEPLPSGFQVIVTELEGPVFADTRGKTLYKWPSRANRNGDVGEQKGRPTCDDRKITENAGLMSPYPGGYTLPDVETRPSCVDVWPPVYASDKAKTVKKWTVIQRTDGKKQWAYEGFALYTSVLDLKPGDVYGGTQRKLGNDTPGYRSPVGPPPNIPAQFSVYSVAKGRMLGTARGYSVYVYDKDTKGRSKCVGACQTDWAPALAGESAVARGEWTIIERSPGTKQWAFRKKPVYTHVKDERFLSYEGEDAPFWHTVFTQTEPDPPNGFTVQDTRSGQVLADSGGRTLYIYYCGEDTIDQLACDHPNASQAYRLAICGGGDPLECNKTFPYLIAAPNARGRNRTWTIIDIDPKTGKFATAGQLGALHVWAYRGRPIYLFGGDRKPGDVEGDSWGEFNGHRNGFKAFWLRDDFHSKAG